MVWGSRVVTIVLLLSCAFIVVGSLTGRWRLLSVETGSMEPAVPAGAGVVVVPTSVDDVRVGDVIAFGAPESGVPTVHRVAAVEAGEEGPLFRTRGDANPVPDPWVLSVDGGVVQRVVSVSPDLGAFTSLMGDRIVRLELAGLGGVLVLVAGLQAIWSRRCDDPDPVEDRDG